MNKGETVTLFNDMCVMALAVLINKNFEWTTPIMKYKDVDVRKIAT